MQPEDVENKTIAQLAFQFNLRPTYQTLEGHESLERDSLLGLVAYSKILARDQGGCRFLQHMIDRNDRDIFTVIFNATIEDFYDLMRDPFGNYLSQKIMDKSSETQLEKIVYSVKEGPYELAANMHGTRSI